MLRPCVLLCVLTVIFALQLSGCGPRPSDAELGEKLDRIPHIEGVDEPYPLPGIDEAAEAARERTKLIPTGPASGQTVPVPPR